MTDNPYAPPKAAVGEVPPEVPAVRPREVRNAVILLWIAVIVGDVVSLVNSVLNGGKGPTPKLAFTLLLLPVGLLITWWFNGKILKGRNWARILVAVALALGPFNVLFAALNPALEGQRLFPILTYGATLPMYAGACWLLFRSPGKQWFARRTA